MDFFYRKFRLQFSYFPPSNGNTIIRRNPLAFMINIIYAIFISVWTYLISRVIAFGFRDRHTISWSASFSSTSWYSLTPIRLRLPKKNLKYFKLILILSSSMYLFLVDHFVLQISCVIQIISLHTFIPIFVIHPYNDSILFIWSTINLIGICVLIFITYALQVISRSIGILTLIPTTSITFWFFLIQLQLISCTPIKFNGIDEKRRPRII